MKKSRAHLMQVLFNYVHFNYIKCISTRFDAFQFDEMHFNQEISCTSLASAFQSHAFQLNTFQFNAIQLNAFQSTAFQLRDRVRITCECISIICISTYFQFISIWFNAFQSKDLLHIFAKCISIKLNTLLQTKYGLMSRIKRAISYGALLRKITYKDNGFCLQTKSIIVKVSNSKSTKNRVDCIWYLIIYQ